MNPFAGFALAAWLAAATAAPAAAQVARYAGACDSSAAVALDDDHFVVANDENDTLGVYRRGEPQAVGQVKLAKFLDTKSGEESDIEGAARIGKRIYWITSHGSNSRGKEQKSRQRFFATELRPGTPPSLAPIGKPYEKLLRDLDDDDALKPYKLASAARRPAEAEGGLNIEGLAATPEGELLIGLRNPLAGGRTLIVPLRNPGDVIDGKQAKFGKPTELDLGARGIRSIELVGSSYLIVAGPVADVGSFALYRWSGKRGDAATPLAGIELKDLRPEAMFAVPRTGQVQLLSDDGGVTKAGVECKKLPLEQQRFRSLIVTP